MRLWTYRRRPARRGRVPHEEGNGLRYIVAATSSTKDMYPVMVKASLGLRRQRAPASPHRLLQERGAKHVRL